MKSDGIAPTKSEALVSTCTSSPESSPAHALNQDISSPKVPTPIDHLIHLIQHNVFRGLSSNKSVVEQWTFKNGPFQNTLKQPVACEITMVFAVQVDFPPSLHPTSLQMSLPHASWINTLPFPAMRDNLITWQHLFNHSEFLNDLVGNYINMEDNARGSLSFDDSLPECEGEDEVTTGRRGLILWGEPHEKESWELTPGFIRKWAWSVEGCQELIQSSNQWRAARGESPLEV